MSEASGKLSVEYIPIEQVKPYENNPRVNDAAVNKVAASIQEFGWQQPIVVDKDNVVIVGHTRLKAAQQLGFDEVPIHVASELDEEKVKAYRLADNRTNEFAEWDIGKLEDELKAIDDSDFDFDMDTFGFDGIESPEIDDEGQEELRDEYSQNVGKVIYEPKDTNWTASDLYEQTDKFDDEIDALDCDDDIKEMLRIRAHWFCDFKFSHIADYYAYQATPEVQRVMEALGMVLLDKDQLIENGFADIVESL